MFDERIAELNKRAETMCDPVYDKRVYTVDEIQDILGVGRNAAYELIRKNLFRSVKFCGHIRVSKRSFDSWLDTQLE